MLFRSDADPTAAHDLLRAVDGAGVDLADVSRVLEEEGVAAFVASFDDLLADLTAKVVSF